jgi:hypothetical protein
LLAVASRAADAQRVSSTAPTEPARRAAMSVRGAAFLGIGSMVGAGIFAPLGEAGAVAGAAAAAAENAPARGA